MTKRELTDAMRASVEQRRQACAKRLRELDDSAKTERGALLTQSNLYQNAEAFIGFAGDTDQLPEPYLRRLGHLLAGEDALRERYEQADGEERTVLAVYLHNLLFLRQNFLLRYQQEAGNASDPKRKAEATLKLRTVEELMDAYRTCYRELGGRKDLTV